jgi:CelD/BcsL family acetyltransferase involved in cellulose biosynthesis
MREVGKAGELTPTVAENPQQAEQFLKDLKQLHQARWTAAGMPGSFGNAFFSRFHDELVRTRFQTGEIQLLRVTAGDQAVGYLYNFVYRGHVYYYQAGIDYNTWSTSASRPGFICHYFAIEHNRLGGANVYDLMEGDSRYKRELGTQSTMMYWMVLQRNRPKFRVERSLKRFVNVFRSGEPQVEIGTGVE